MTSWLDEPSGFYMLGKGQKAHHFAFRVVNGPSLRGHMRLEFLRFGFLWCDTWKMFDGRPTDAEVEEAINDWLLKYATRRVVLSVKHNKWTGFLIRHKERGADLIRVRHA